MKTDRFYAARYSFVAIFQLVLAPIAFAFVVACLFFAVLMMRVNDEPLPIGCLTVVLVGGAAAVYGYFLGKGYGKARLVCCGADRLSAIFTSPVGYGVLFGLVIFTQTAVYIFAEVYWAWHIH